MKKFDISSKLFSVAAYDNGKMPLLTAMKFLMREKFDITTRADERPLPKYGIVRKKLVVEKGSKNLSFDNLNLPVEFATDKSYLIMFLEIDGISEPKQDLIDENITEDDFISSLLTVYIETNKLNRVPIVDEIVFVDYLDRTDATSIFFKGLPTEKMIDPRVKFYKNKSSNRTRNSFATGA
mgnify:FL=1|tara:strand:- start:1277 stop:1819 length:543 start_codon:yes stop_codon:yes gene_type:complete